MKKGETLAIVIVFSVLVLIALVVLKGRPKDGSGMNPKPVFVQTSSKYLSSTWPNVEVLSDVKVISSSEFQGMIDVATTHPRKRKMSDLTRDPPNNSLQILINTWTEGSYSPVHMHPDYSEAFVILDGALAFFTFSTDGSAISCRILQSSASGSSSKQDRAIIVEKGVYHAMTAAPRNLGFPGHAIIFENSGHKYDPSISTKALAPFAPAVDDGLNGDPSYFHQLLQRCPRNN